ncbi:hypothetical protein A2331_05120 [Candidatus Falkowbacteria bacterium RIFOXYB2_FULL_34_18]|uniref:Gcp-like domain-containing protein n=1 Tax=Candidatus Falkowbacteria bacterium RIFOXYD2_FULL_34_120 TaxID=1798007 RepID=A0A1F5TN06_9BACT|nr:MAG: hypothetical protein A2500_07125 [Candidatus Falkowbacteria bacterium RIFOXYC12_FULL_34_55]OGF28727.1 MAG: hypothetical protein A2331_05120 [Candidatus Falkowbacteria bacterium RIFOXYB2_FULL_34_18]OGF38092.1 MAG: hypothetical protein A2466_04300 [Candidatus Falkowbacteria bacterium RIFOXYC2_FULL_34_220]OGF38346.1 MAG: hypothetical protein A2515_06330 [Candidatus Falkowbacteria bacterium RIFOXYD12_FULL_34_57]OGF40333.1 MAG: hypothetical protein A2531_00590 [Candidatus Falkowbacteria bact
MILHIDTSDKSRIFVAILDKNKEIGSSTIDAGFQHCEKLLPEIDNLLKGLKFSLKGIKGVNVVNYGASFTSLRIGVITANAMGYALGIPVYAVDKNNVKKKGGVGKEFSIVKPEYGGVPNILISKRSVVD